jgi:hypothetical protein
MFEFYWLFTLVSALFVPLLLVYSPGPAAAQFNPASSELSQVLLPKLPSPPNFRYFRGVPTRGVSG